MGVVRGILGVMTIQQGAQLRGAGRQIVPAELAGSREAVHALHVDRMAPSSHLDVDIGVHVVPDVQVVLRGYPEVPTDEVEQCAPEPLRRPALHGDVDRDLCERRCHPADHIRQVVLAHVEIAGDDPVRVVECGDVVASSAEGHLIGDLGSHELRDHFVGNAQFSGRDTQDVGEFVLLHRVIGGQLRLDTHPDRHRLEDIL